MPLPGKFIVGGKRWSGVSHPTPPFINKDAITYIKSWINPGFNLKKYFESSSPYHPADADRLGKRLDEEIATISCLSNHLLWTDAGIPQIDLPCVGVPCSRGLSH